MPPVPDEVREQVRRESEGLETPELHRLLSERDPGDGPDPAPLRPPAGPAGARDLRRHRAAARVLPRRPPAGALGRRAGWSSSSSRPDRDELRRRIDARFLAMMEQGALDEVRALGEREPRPDAAGHARPRGAGPARPSARRDRASTRPSPGGRATRARYAKRQFTWFRHQLPDWPWVEPEKGFEAAMAAAQCPGAPVNIW